jgi:hypothetical protein
MPYLTGHDLLFGPIFCPTEEIQRWSKQALWLGMTNYSSGVQAQVAQPLQHESFDALKD